MDKLQIKKEIESLKKKLVEEKESWKNKNDQFKANLEGLKKQAAYNAARKDQLGRDAAARIKREIANKKLSWQNNEKRFEKDAYDSIKRDIERLKSQLA